jgi:hypothetical protein
MFHLIVFHLAGCLRSGATGEKAINFFINRLVLFSMIDYPVKMTVST